jgi:hypothetical protein
MFEILLINISFQVLMNSLTLLEIGGIIMKKDKKKDQQKQDIKFVKLSELSKVELSKTNMEDLWVLKPQNEKSSVMARKCGCRSVCQA